MEEIKNRIKKLQNLHKENEEKLDSIQKTAILLCINECKVMLSFLDTLEVKEARDIWHDASEKPELEQPLLIIMKGTHKDFRRHYRIGCYGKRANDIPTWVINGCYSDSFISKWCYISDILKQTLEVKEVDLEKEANEAWNYIFSRGWDENSRMALKHDEYMAFAKHFYELGLSARKENKV